MARQLVDSTRSGSFNDAACAGRPIEGRLKRMSHHDVYSALVDAVAAGTLKEPFSAAGFRHACPGFGEATYRAFLWEAQGVSARLNE